VEYRGRSGRRKCLEEELEQYLLLDEETIGRVQQQLSEPAAWREWK